MPRMTSAQEDGGRFATGEPSAGPEIVAAIVRLHAEAERWLAAIPPAEFAASQRQSGVQGEKWSPANHVRHLAKSTFPLAQALALPKFVIGWRFGRGPEVSRDFLTVRDDYRRTLRETGATAGRFTPTPVALPDDLAAWQIRVLASWRASIVALTGRIPRWNERALDRYRVPHPILGKMTVREILFFSLYHYQHHLEQIAARR
jgi:hypothetical protein